VVGAGAPGLDDEGMPEGGGIAEARLEKAGDDVGSRPYLEGLRRRPRVREVLETHLGRAGLQPVACAPAPSRRVRTPAGFSF
jgi:hypothetical protein